MGQVFVLELISPKGWRYKYSSDNFYFISCYYAGQLVTKATCYKGNTFSRKHVTTITCYKWNLLSRQLVTKATCYQGNLLPRQLVTKATCYQGNLLPRQLATKATCYQGNLLPRQLVTKATFYQGVCYQGNLFTRQLVTKVTCYQSIYYQDVILSRKMLPRKKLSLCSVTWKMLPRKCGNWAWWYNYNVLPKQGYQGKMLRTNFYPEKGMRIDFWILKMLKGYKTKTFYW